MGQKKKKKRDGLKTVINKCQLAHEDVCSSGLFSFHLSYRPKVCPQTASFYSSSSPAHSLLRSLQILEGDCMGQDIRTGGISPGMIPHCYIFYHYLGNYSDPQNSTFLLFNPLSLQYFATATLLLSRFSRV